ncbi:MerR family transcriptional regulator [Enterococcus sp. AZ103]|uniref:MerR family transcriptional regulator n=1 Tax=Enterococcus sp. AZ103 TaxID=2774628 RepID=UPI003F287D7B
MFKIKQFSKLSGTSSRMLRHYEKMDLLKPAKIDPDNNYRYYQAEQLTTVNKIKKLQSFGFSLTLIKEILNQENPVDLEKYLYTRQQELAEELAVITQQKDSLAQIQAELDDRQNLLDYHVVLKELPSRKVMSIRKVIADASGEGELWQTLDAVVQAQKIQFSSPPLGVSIYHDEEYQDQQIDLELQSTVVGDYSDMEEVKFFVAPAIQTASVTFQGSYEQMPQVMNALARWLETQDYEMAGPMFNINHVSPAQTPDPEKWVTEACLVLK